MQQSFLFLFCLVTSSWPAAWSRLNNGRILTSKNKKKKKNERRTIGGIHWKKGLGRNMYLMDRRKKSKTPIHTAPIPSPTVNPRTMQPDTRAPSLMPITTTALPTTSPSSRSSCPPGQKNLNLDPSCVMPYETDQSAVPSLLSNMALWWKIGVWAV